MRGRQVVGAAHDPEQPDLELRGLRVGVERAFVGEQRDPQAGHRAIGLQRDLAVHVEVAREPGRDQVLGAVLDPLHGPAEQERRSRRHDVPGVDRDLVAEPTADVGRDDPDLLLGQTRDHREHRADRVGGLRGHVDRGLPGRRVHVGDTPAGLEWSRVAPRVERVERDDLVGRGERRVGGLLVAALPVVDAVVGLVFLVGADHRRVRLERTLRRHHRLERLVVDVDQLEGVLRDVGVLGDHRRDLLALEPHLVGDEHRLGVVAHRRHPGEVVLRHQLAGHDGDHAGERLSARGVDRVELRVRVGAAQDRHVEHAGQLHVVDVVALAPDEAVVFDAADAVAQSADLFGVGHRFVPPQALAGAAAAARSAAAAWIALTMFM